jgi:Lon protease-like protein
MAGEYWMLKVKQSDLKRFESIYPGITKQIMSFESAMLPVCPICDSTRTAIVEVGIIARTMTIAAATSKCQLVPDEPKPAEFYCGDCRRYFDAELSIH